MDEIERSEQRRSDPAELERAEAERGELERREQGRLEQEWLEQERLEGEARTRGDSERAQKHHSQIDMETVMSHRATERGARTGEARAKEFEARGTGAGET